MNDQTTQQSCGSLGEAEKAQHISWNEKLDSQKLDALKMAFEYLASSYQIINGQIGDMNKLKGHVHVDGKIFYPEQPPRLTGDLNFIKDLLK